MEVLAPLPSSAPEAGSRLPHLHGDWDNPDTAIVIFRSRVGDENAVVSGRLAEQVSGAAHSGMGVPDWEYC